MLSDDSGLQVARFLYPWVEYGRQQAPMLVQVYDFATQSMKSRPNEPGGGGKPKSRPPFDMGILDLHDHCAKVVVDAVSQKDSPTEYDSKELNSCYHKARRLLGYEAPVMLLPAYVCHGCGSPLIVASDAMSSVSCAEKCGVEYPTHTWLDILTTRLEAS